MIDTFNLVLVKSARRGSAVDACGCHEAGDTSAAAMNADRSAWRSPHSSSCMPNLLKGD
jgi:hypothetical protein